MSSVVEQPQTTKTRGGRQPGHALRYAKGFARGLLHHGVGHYRRYTHRVAISNHRLISADADTVAFRWKDYRIKTGDRQKVMRLETGEFIRRFLIHVLPDGFHRIRHYGLLAGACRKGKFAHIRALLNAATSADPDQATEDPSPSLTLREPCPCCGGPMRIDEIFRRGQKPSSRAPPRDQAA